ncbi:MAG: hypothetical protein LKF31_00215 [Muribaculaceae bacterium]|jgi:hypothetical protein|nr:hypothetical protein [Muribaculaceae bacterium]
MKRLINILILLALVILPASAKTTAKNYSVSDVIKAWKARTIKVNATTPDIAGFFKAFATAYPGNATSPTLTRLSTGKSKVLKSFSLDAKNGFISSSESSVKQLQMCYWNKNNGNKLIAVYLTDFAEGAADDPDAGFFKALMFYDYDAASRTMTPLATPPADGIPFGLNCQVALPSTGKDIKFEQKAGTGSNTDIATVFLHWNGNSFSTNGVVSQRHKQLRRDDIRSTIANFGIAGFWANTIAKEKNAKPSEFAFIDIDGDSDEELFLRDTPNRLGCIINSYFHVIAQQGFKSSISIYNGFVTVTSSAGTGGAVNTEYHKIENSKVVASCDIMEYNDENDNRITEYNGETNQNSKAAKEAKAIIAKVPKTPIDIDNLGWMPFSKLKSFVRK